MIKDPVDIDLNNYLSKLEAKDQFWEDYYDVTYKDCLDEVADDVDNTEDALIDLDDITLAKINKLAAAALTLPHPVGILTELGHVVFMAIKNHYHQLAEERTDEELETMWENRDE